MHFDTLLAHTHGYTARAIRHLCTFLTLLFGAMQFTSSLASAAGPQTVQCFEEGCVAHAVVTGSLTQVPVCPLPVSSDCTLEGDLGWRVDPNWTDYLVPVGEWKVAGCSIENWTNISNPPWIIPVSATFAGPVRTDEPEGSCYPYQSPCVNGHLHLYAPFGNGWALTDSLDNAGAVAGSMTLIGVPYEPPVNSYGQCTGSVTESPGVQYPDPNFTPSILTKLGDGSSQATGTTHWITLPGDGYCYPPTPQSFDITWSWDVTVFPSCDDTGIDSSCCNGNVDPVYISTTPTYKFAALSLLQAEQNFKFRIPRRRIGAMTLWDWNAEYKLDADGLVSCNSKVTIKTKVETPEWTNVGRRSDAVQEEWSRFLGATWVHEGGHISLVEKHFAKVLEKIIGLTPKAATVVLQDIGKALQDESDQYDRATGYGKTQGAVLDTNIE